MWPEDAPTAFLRVELSCGACGADDEAFCMWAGAGSDLVARRTRAVKRLIPGHKVGSCTEDRAKSDFPFFLGLVATPYEAPELRDFYRLSNKILGGLCP